MIARLMGLKTISPKDLLTTIQENNVHVYDLNSSTVYASGHIPGAIHLNHETFNGEELPADNHAEVVFIAPTLCVEKPQMLQNWQRVWDIQMQKYYQRVSPVG